MTYVHVEGVMLGMLSWVARLDRHDWVARLPPVPRYLLSQPSYLPFLSYLHLFSTYLPTL
jgi:hypothetical protein